MLRSAILLALALISSARADVVTFVFTATGTHALGDDGIKAAILGTGTGTSPMVIVSLSDISIAHTATGLVAELTPPPDTTAVVVAAGFGAASVEQALKIGLADKGLDVSDLDVCATAAGAGECSDATIIEDAGAAAPPPPPMDWHLASDLSIPGDKGCAGPPDAQSMATWGVEMCVHTRP